MSHTKQAHSSAYGTLDALFDQQSVQALPLLDHYQALLDSKNSVYASA